MTSRRIWAMARTSILRTYRQPASLIWIVAMPLLFAVVISRLILGGGLDGPGQATVVDLDGGPQAQAFIEQMAATPLVVTVVTDLEAQEQIQVGRLDMAVVLPAEFGASVTAGQPKLQVWAGPVFQPGGPVEKRAQAVAAGLAAGEPAPRVQVDSQAPRRDSQTDKLPGQKIIFAFYTMFALATMINQGVGLKTQKQWGTLQRTLVLGVRPGEVVTAHWLGMVLTGIIQLGIILAVTGLLGAPWLASGLGPLLLTAGATVLAVVGLGLAVGGFARSPNQVYGLSGALGSLAAMLGGGFWPLEIVPLAVQQVGRLSPVYWALEAFKEAYVYRGLPGLWTPVAVLLFMGVLGLVVGTVGLRRTVELT